jgi:hypothetical protein
MTYTHRILGGNVSSYEFERRPSLCIWQHRLLIFAAMADGETAQDCAALAAGKCDEADILVPGR